MAKVQHTFKVHAIVAEAFHGREPDCEVNHINGVKHDNSAGNLEWVSRSENMRHAWTNDLMLRGSQAVIAKLDEAAVEEIIFDMIAGKSNSELAAFYPVARGTISKIRSNDTWKHVRPDLRPLPESPNKTEPKLSAELASEVREMHAAGISMSEIGRHLGVHSGTVHGVITGRTWKV